MKKSNDFIFRLPSRFTTRYDELMIQTGLEDKGHLLGNALELFEWAVHQASMGKRIVAISEAGEKTNQNNPILQKIQPR